LLEIGWHLLTLATSYGRQVWSRLDNVGYCFEKFGARLGSLTLVREDIPRVNVFVSGVPLVSHRSGSVGRWRLDWG